MAQNSSATKPHVSQHLQETPKTIRSNAGTVPIAEMRSIIADQMDGEFITSDFDEFTPAYLPFEPDDDLVVECLRKMTQVHDEQRVPLVTEIAQGQFQLTGFHNPPATMKEPELFKRLRDVAQVVGKVSIEGRSPRYMFYDCPHRRIASDIKGDGNKIDGCFVANKDFGTLPQYDDNDEYTDPEANSKHEHRTTTIAVPGEWKKCSDLTSELQNNRQLVSAVVQIMNDDARRLFTLGLTLVGEEMRLWYFGRSYSAVSSKVNFVEEPKYLVKAFIALKFATEAELGYDHTVIRHSKNKYTYRLPVPDPNAYNLVTDDMSDVSELTETESSGSESESEASSADSSQDEPRNPKFRFFRTVEIVSDYRSNSVTGRMSRVWLVEEVVSQNEHAARTEGEERYILKDVWLEASAPTEQEIQNAIFKDIEAFAKPNSEKDKEWMQRFRKRHEGLFKEDKQYKKYFLTIELDYKGERTKPMPAKIRRLHGLLHKKQSVSRGATLISGNRERPNHGSHKDLQSKALEMIKRDFKPRQQYRVLFRENCTTVGNLRKLGEVFEVLRQVLIPIQLMFVAGWVHRDISAGNILAYRQSEADTWTAKLSDLEYAKPFPPTDDVEAAKDPKTGTPYFMPIEVHTSRCILVPKDAEPTESEGVKAVPTPDDLPARDALILAAFENLESEAKQPEAAPKPDSKIHVVHNFQHDLETLWWLILYVLTALTNHRPSKDYSEKIFQNTMTPPARIDAFYYSIEETLGDVLIPSAKPLIAIMDATRARLKGAYIEREEANKTNDPASYVLIHLIFASFLDQLCTKFPSCMDLDLVNPSHVPLDSEIAVESQSGAPASSAENAVPTTPPRTTVPPPRASPESRPSRLPPPARVKAKRPASPNVVGQERVEGTRSKKHKH